MSDATATFQHDNPKLGMILMASMASCLPVMDAIGKYLTDFLSPASIAFFRFVLQADFLFRLAGHAQALGSPERAYQNGYCPRRAHLRCHAIAYVGSERFTPRNANRDLLCGAADFGVLFNLVLGRTSGVAPHCRLLRRLAWRSDHHTPKLRNLWHLRCNAA